MIVALCTERIRTLDDIRAFLGGNEAADITPRDREAAYAFIERAAGQVPVPSRPVEGREGPGEGVPRQGHRLLGLPAEPADRAAAPHGPDPRPPAASSRPALRDGVHDRRRGAAGRGGRGLRPALRIGAKRILWRQYHVFGDERFERLAGISNGHIYNLRGRRAYRSARTTFRATRGAISSIGKWGSSGRSGFACGGRCLMSGEEANGPPC